MKKILCLLLLIILSITFQAQPVAIVVQTGHNHYVKAVTFSKDGKYIASACNDGAVKLWDAKLGLEIFTFYDLDKYAASVAFSPDGKYLLSTGSDEYVVREIRTGKKIAIIHSEDDEEEEDAANGIFSGDSKYCFAIDDNRTMRWEVGECVNPLKYDENAQIDKDSVAFLNPPATKFYYEGHTAYIKCLFVLPGNKYLLSSAADSTIRIWDIVSGKQVRVIKNNFDLDEVILSADGKRVIAAGRGTANKTILSTWDIATGNQLFSAPVKTPYLQCLSVSPDGKWLTAGNLMNYIFIYSLPSFKLVKTIAGHTQTVNSVAFSNDSKFILSVSDDHDMKLWEAATGRLVKNFKKTIARIYNLTYEKKHRLISTVSEKGKQHETITWEIDHGIGIKNRYLTNDIIITNFYQWIQPVSYYY